MIIASLSGHPALVTLYFVIGFLFTILASFLNRRSKWIEFDTDDGILVSVLIIFLWPIILAGLILVAIPFSAVVIGQWLADVYDEYTEQKREKEAKEIHE